MAQRRSIEARVSMATPTVINDEYDIVIAGDEPYSILPTCLLSADRVVVRL